ncbi:hypothetical protein [uncultured Limosilactobacillus sp.]|nr:hypothetical protein [uncultured Limosilactobacillus sp.]
MYREAAVGASCRPKLRCKYMWAGNSARLVAVIYFEGDLLVKLGWYRGT